MARIRSLKPEFFTSADVVACSPLARLLFIATWCEADREGRLYWKPDTLKLRYLPADKCDVDKLADELEARGMLVRYDVNGIRYASVTGFTRHQIINNRERESVIPESPELPPIPPLKATTTTEGKGREGKERERLPFTRPHASNTSIQALPKWIDADTWDEYKQMRKLIRKPMTARAEQLAVSKLEEFQAQGHDPNKVLEQSIQQSWQGLFAVKDTAGNAKQQPKSFAELNEEFSRKQIEERNERLRRGRAAADAELAGASPDVVRGILEGRAGASLPAPAEEESDVPF